VLTAQSTPPVGQELQQPQTRRYAKPTLSPNRPAPSHAQCTADATQLPKVYTHYAATALFFFFGFKTLWDAFHHEEVGRVGNGG